MQCCSYLILFPLLSCQPSFLFFCLGIHFLFLMLMCVYIKCVYYMPSRYTEYIHGMYNIYIYIFTVQHKDSVCIIYVNDHKCVCVCCLPLLFWLTIFHVLSVRFLFHRSFNCFSLVCSLSYLLSCSVAGSCSFRSCTYIHALSLRLNSLRISCPFVFHHSF